MFVLAEVGELSAPEIAQVMGTKLNTVYSRLRLARSRMKASLEAMQNAQAHGAVTAQGSELADAFCEDALSESTERFSSLLMSTAQATTKGTADAWQGALSALRREVMALRPSALHRAHVEDLLHVGRVAIARAIQSSTDRILIERDSWGVTLGRSMAALVGEFRPLELVEALGDQLEAMGLSGVTVVQFDPDDATHGRVVVQCDRQRKALGHAGSVEVGALLRGDAGHEVRPCRVVEPLVFSHACLGFTVIDYGPPHGALYEALGAQLSAVVEGARLVREVEAREQERAALQQRLEDRAEQLERAYAALRQGQQRLLVSEGMTSVGQLVTRPRSLRGLLDDALTQLDEVLGPLTAVVAMPPEGATEGDVLLGDAANPELVFALTRGTPTAASSWAPLLAALTPESRLERQENALAIPLRASGRLTAVLLLQLPRWDEHELDLVLAFANQATVALQNGQLYQMAAHDPLTDVYARRFFDRWLPRQLQIAVAERTPLSLLMIDMDSMKAINDTNRPLRW